MQDDVDVQLDGDIALISARLLTTLAQKQGALPKIAEPFAVRRILMHEHSSQE